MALTSKYDVERYIWIKACPKELGVGFHLKSLRWRSGRAFVSHACLGV